MPWSSGATASPAARQRLRPRGPPPSETLEREERLRAELKALARSVGQPVADVPQQRPFPTLDGTHAALLARFARSGEVNLFAATLSHALDCSAVFGERVVLDVSGSQLGLTLVALGTARAEATSILTTLYPYLLERSGGGTRCDALLDTIDPQEARNRVASWVDADIRRRDARHVPVQGPERIDDPRNTKTHPLPAQQTAQPVASTFYRRNLNRNAR